MTDHLLVFPERATAEEVAAELAEEGFAQVRIVREIARTEDDAESAEWGVYLVDDRLPDVEGGGAWEGLRRRFMTLVDDNEGWYDDNPTGWGAPEEE